MSITTTTPYPTLSLAELAAHAVLEASNRLDEKKIPLSDEAKRRLHGVWIDIKTALSDTTIPQIMHTVEKDIIAQLAPQMSENIDLASKIESLWEQLPKSIGDKSVPIGTNSYRSVHKEWENEALTLLWSAISQQIDQPPSLNTIQDIEAWFENPANSEALMSIKKIDFYFRNIRVFPPQLLKCSQLQTLNISNNQITVLPESFGNLNQLQDLKINDNQITTLPESFGNLSQLQFLYLYNSQITTLPVSFGNLSQLQFLFLSNNQITTLPESLGNFDQLKQLDLSINQITALPESFGNLSQLQDLKINDNQLTTLPVSFGSLSQLQFLYLSNNQITKFPESFSNLRQLKIFDI